MPKAIFVDSCHWKHMLQPIVASSPMECSDCIDFRKYNEDTDSSNRYGAKLMLYYPWFDEQADLLGGYPSYEAHHRHVCDTVLTNESK